MGMSHNSANTFLNCPISRTWAVFEENQRLWNKSNIAMLNESAPPKQKPLKPGKWYGIVAMLCGVETILFLCYSVVVESFGLVYQNPWDKIGFILGTPSLFFAITALVFGIMGRKTEGRHYANVGIVLSLSFGLLILFGLIFAFCWFVILGNPT